MGGILVLEVVDQVGRGACGSPEAAAGAELNRIQSIAAGKSIRNPGAMEPAQNSLRGSCIEMCR